MATTVAELIERLQTMPADAYIILVIDAAGGFQSVCSGDMTVELGDTNGSEVIIGGDDDE